MKNIIIASALILSVTAGGFAQIDRSKAPNPGPAPKIQIGKYESFTLKNGLKVILVENHKLPVVAYSLVLDNDPELQRNKAGYVELVGDMLTSGTTSKTKAQLDDEIDFIGASISASSTGVYGSSLKKHNDKLLALISDILLNPSFPQDEFEKLKNQSLSGLAAEKNNPTAIARNLQQVLVYGRNHPYGEVVTEATLDSVTLDDIKGFYKRNFIPNVGYLAVVGDITRAEVEPLINKYFGNWAKGTPVKGKYPAPSVPSNVQIHMHDRPNSVQTSLNFVYPVSLKLSDPDYIRVRMLENILGGGSTGRLFKNLREGHGYTYGAYSTISADKLTGKFYAGAEVRNEVADSAIREIIFELDRMANKGITQQELEDSKKKLTGTFARSLENPTTVANFAINIDRYKLPKDFYENYLTNLNAITLEEMNAVARKYILPYNYHLVVVGSRDSVEKKITKYDADQKISFYDNYGATAKQLRDAPAGVTETTVIDAYITSVGGLEALNSLQDVTMKGSASFQGMPIEFHTVKKSPDKVFFRIFAGEMTFMKVVYDGKAGVQTDQMGNLVSMNADQLKEAKYDAVPFIETVYKDLGITANLLGIDYVDGSDAYLVEYVFPNGNKDRCWYSVKNGWMVKKISFTKDGQNTVLYKDYRPVKGIYFPHLMKQDLGGTLTDIYMSSIEVNTGVADGFFQLK